jgi:hypothetical protein
MHLTATEKKCLLSAFDRSAPEGEMIAAAGRLVHLLRKRYRDGYEFISDLESLSNHTPRHDFRAKHGACCDGAQRSGWLYSILADIAASQLRISRLKYLIRVLRNFRLLNPSILGD